MRFTTGFTLLLGAAATGAMALPTPEAEAAAAKTLVKLNLPPPDNWMPGRRLFPSNVIAGYNGELKDYTAKSWNDYILQKCQGFSACTSTHAFQGINSGSTGGVYWFGYVYRGGPTTAADYEREADPARGIANSQVYTVVA